ncbi:hypothetical protein ACPOL_3395 [Acidisarcina polymorpha]|uniref:Uncharacterized protein n=1 Tax=Acidisarcina polymorpha TaxID=2211140 RepID=A0A2Z5G0P6_9BACT|nr:hypothetical protein ACPOL_3395 [Acidisarcina polymorpha]
MFSLLGLQIVAILCATSQPAYAYVDPGSGLLAFQMIGTTFAGVIFVIRKRLRRLLQTRFSRAKVERVVPK